MTYRRVQLDDRKAEIRERKALRYDDFFENVSEILHDRIELDRAKDIQADFEKRNKK